MLKSMTAYGHSLLNLSWGQFVVEIWSVNRRFLEINTHLPKELIRFDADIKKWVSEKVGRGQVNVKVMAHFTSGSPVEVKPNLTLARQLKQVAQKLQQELGVGDLTEQLLVHSPELLEFSESLENEAQWKEDLQLAIDQALSPFSEMKKREGMALQKDVSMRLSNCIPMIDQIEELAPHATSRYRSRLVKSMEAVAEGEVESEDKVLREIALYAEKIDITEEIVRFRSHVNQFGHILDSEEKSVGKPLEFLLQEMLREINTIGAKSSEVDVSRQVVAIKSELERIREQIQNVE